MTKIPVTVITGYLGAGKTTLLRAILDSPESRKRRIAIVMNEFGRIGIDGRSIEGRGVRIAELSGGCVCCSLSGEFRSAVVELISLAKPEWILVETTGVAEPSALAYDIENSIDALSLYSIITVVDGDSLLRFPSLGHTGIDQIELADLLLLNKTDLLSEKMRAEAKGRLNAINGHARIIEAVRCQVDPEMVFRKWRPESGITAPDRHPIDPDCLEYSSGKALDREKVLAFFRKLPAEIYRAKGFVRVDGGSFRLDLTAGRLNVEEFNNDKTELVFIGKGIKRFADRITEGLDACAPKE